MMVLPPVLWCPHLLLLQDFSVLPSGSLPGLDFTGKAPTLLQ